MRLQVFTPGEVVLDVAIQKLRAEAENGSFGMLPHHIDLVTALVPGVLSYLPADAAGEERFVAVDEGVLVKCGESVRVSVRRAALGDLDELAQSLAREIREVDAHESSARSAVARLEAGALRRLAELEEGDRE